MSQDLGSLERDVEQARSRLVGDLARLRSPTTLARFKDQAWEEVDSFKDRAVGKARHTLMDGVHQLTADLKARAAANPAPTPRPATPRTKRPTRADLLAVVA